MAKKPRPQDRPAEDPNEQGPARSLSFRWSAGPTRLQLALRFSIDFDRAAVQQLDPLVRQAQLLMAVADACADLIADMNDEDYVNRALAKTEIADDQLGQTVDVLSADKVMQWAGRNMLWFQPDQQMMKKVQDAMAHGDDQLAPDEKRIRDGAGMTTKEFGYAYMMLVLAAAAEREGVEPASMMSKLLVYLLEAKAATEMKDAIKPALN